MHRTTIVLAAVLAITGCLFQLTLQSWMRPHATQGIYFQQYSSESLMQTVSIEDLRNAPLESLSHLHIQPPVFDAIRALLARFWPGSDVYALVRHVDRALYVLWAVLSGLLAAVIFLWLRKTTNIYYASITACIFMAHPAGIFYASLLDATLLSTVLIAWTYYLLWGLYQDPRRSIAPLTVAVLALFFTRSVFQWPTILLFSFVLVLLKVPRRNILVFLLVCGGIAGLYLGKQFSQFGILSTSSFTGLNLSQSIGYKVDYRKLLNSIEQDLPDTGPLPPVLSRKTKLLGTTNYNQIGNLEANRMLMKSYKESLANTPVGELLRSYWQNLLFYFLPSSRYTAHVIVDRIPWRNVFDRLFSGPILPLLLVLGGAASLARSDRRHIRADIALMLPGLFLFLVSVLCEKGENMRFKFFMEPVYFVFIAAQLYFAGDQLVQRWLSRRTASGPSDAGDAGDA